MKYLRLKLSVCIFIAFVLPYGQGLDTVWVERFLAGAPGTGEPCHSRGHSIVFDEAGYVYILGQGWLDFSYGLLLKYSVNGGPPVWSKYLTGYVEYWEPNALCVCYEDLLTTLAAAGTERTTEGDPQNAIRTYKYSEDGELLWRARYRASYGGLTEDVAMDDTGNVYVVGADFINDVPPQARAIILRYNAVGTTGNIGIIDWSKTLTGNSTFPSWLNFFRGVVWSQGYIYVTGDVADAPASGGVNLITRKYNPQTGALIWSRKFAGVNVDQGYKIAKDNVGNIYVAGRSTSLGSGNYGLLVLRYTPAGDTVIRQYDIAGNNFIPAGAAVDNLGNFYVTGTVSYQVGGVDAFLAKFSAGCSFEWIKYYDGPGNGSDQAWGIALDNLGNVYIAGETDVPPIGSDGQDYFAQKYNPSGVNCWTVLYDGPGTTIRTDGAYDIAVDNSNNVYVTGTSDSATTWDCTTIKYYADPTVGINDSRNLILKPPITMFHICPNPFIEKTDIRYATHDARYKIAGIEIYDASGRSVKQFNDLTAQRVNSVAWDGTDDSGCPVPAGIYFVHLEAGDYQQMKKVTLVR